MLIRRTFNLPITQNQSLQVCWRKHAHMRRHWLTQALCQALFNLLFIICKTLGSLTLELLLYFPGVKADFFSVFLQNFRILLIFLFYFFFLICVIAFFEDVKKWRKYSLLVLIRTYRWSSSQVFFKDSGLIMCGLNQTIMISYPLDLLPGKRKRLYLLLSCPFFILPSLVLHTLAIVSL